MKLEEEKNLLFEQRLLGFTESLHCQFDKLGQLEREFLGIACIRLASELVCGASS